MKVIVCLIIFVTFALPWTISAQTLDEKIDIPATRLEQFLRKKDLITINKTQKLGNITGMYGSKITINTLTIYEPEKEATRIRGLQITVEDGSSLGKTKISYLDMDEVEHLGTAISYMVSLLGEEKKEIKWDIKPDECTEIAFSTRGNFKLGIRQWGEEKKAEAYASSGMSSKATCLFPPSNLSLLQKIIDNGISLLKE